MTSSVSPAIFHDGLNARDTRKMPRFVLQDVDDILQPLDFDYSPNVIGSRIQM